MKKFGFLIILFLFLFSCQFSELEFSCDPVINQFVLENQEELSQITIQELVAYEVPLQRAIYNSWDYQKKREAWHEKLYYVLDTEDFTETESEHIYNLIEHIVPDYFLEENIESEAEIRSQFADDWINYAVEELGWTDYFVAFMVYRLYTEQSQFDAELSQLRVLAELISTDSEPGDCGCSTGSDYCVYLECHPGGCTVTGGCGWLGQHTCDGLCY